MKTPKFIRKILFGIIILSVLTINAVATPVSFEDADSYLNISYNPTEPPQGLKEKVTSINGKLKAIYVDSLLNQFMHDYTPAIPPDELKISTLNAKLKLLYLDSRSNQLQLNPPLAKPPTQLESKIKSVFGKIKVLYLDSASNQLQYKYTPIEPPSPLKDYMILPNAKLKIVYLDSGTNQLQQVYNPIKPSQDLKQQINSIKGKLKILYLDSRTNQLQDSYTPTKPSHDLSQSLKAKIKILYLDSLNSQLQVSLNNTTAPPPKENIPPIVNFSYEVKGLTVQFTSTSYDPDGYVVSYLWSFGDGHTSTEQNPTHTYSMTGEYTVTLTVTDNEGAKSTKRLRIKVESVIEKVEVPEKIASGLNLVVRVVTKQDTNVRVDFNGIVKERYGRDLTFTFDTKGLAGNYDIRISANGATVTKSVYIYKQIDQNLIKELEDLKRVCRKTMESLSEDTATEYIKTGEHYITGFIAKKAVKSLEDKIKADYDDQIKEFMKKLSEQNKRYVESFKDCFEDFADNSLGNFFTTVEDSIARGLDIYDAFKGVTFNTYFLSKYNEIDERTKELEERPIVGENAEKYIQFGKEAIKNTKYKSVYTFDIGITKLQPSLNYLYEKNEKARNCKILGFIVTPWDLADVMWADANAILTIPALYNVLIQHTPPDKPQIKAAPVIVAIAKAIMAYIEVSNKIVEASPAVITAGIHASTAWSAEYINGTHYNVIEAIKSKSTGVAYLKDNRVYLSGGNVVIMVSPDGKIIGFEYTKDHSVLTSSKDVKVVVYNPTPKVFQIKGTSPTVTLDVILDKTTYNINETVNLTVTLNANQNVTGVLFTFIPEENVTFRKFVDNQSFASYIYQFKCNEMGLKRIKVYFTIGNIKLAEVSKTFKVGVGEVEGALITTRYEKYYDPGEIQIEVTVRNVGDRTITPTLEYLNYTERLNPIAPNEAITKKITLNITKPGKYEFPIYIKTDKILDGDVVSFTVRAIDTIFVQPKTDKAIYKFNETVNVTIHTFNLTKDITIPCIIEIRTPSGKVLTYNGKTITFTPKENGTYIVRAKPLLPDGYYTILGDTMFIVEEQSSLTFEYVLSNSTVTIIVKSDKGALVESAEVVLGDKVRYTDSNGIVTFNVTNETYLPLIIKKLGFNPVVTMLNLTKIKGDFNGNRIVDIGDVCYVAYIVVGKLPHDPRADFNGNGRVDIGDLAKIAYYLLGKINRL